MNLADSVKYILKNKSQNFITELWKEDLKYILKEIGQDLTYLIKSGSSSVKSFKKSGYQINVKELVESGADTLLILKILPVRIKKGFSLFKDAFAEELEKQPDSKQKTIFCLKVFGAVSSFAVGTVYNLKIGKTDFALVGLRRRNAFTRFLVAELIFKISQRLMQKFLVELEQHVSSKDDLDHVRYFKELLADRSKVVEVANTSEFVPGDRAIEIVEDLKTYIMKGQWNSHKVSHDRKPN